jgi:GTP pyrophosphokinase
MGFATVEDLAEALGSGQLAPARIAEKYSQPAPVKVLTPAHAPAPQKNGSAGGSGIVVMGAHNVLTRVPRCCSPVYGDEIIGYLTRGRGVTVHRRSCVNARSMDDPDRMVPVAWGHVDGMLPARLSLDAYDRVGLLRDITNVVSGENVNIHSMSSTEDERSDSCTVTLTVYTTGVEQLSRLFSRLEAIAGVHTVSRISDA